MLEDLLREMDSMKDARRAVASARFFKTGMGEYGEGDIFIGLDVPEQRRLAKKYSGMRLAGIKKLLSSKVHEHRLTALLILAERYRSEKKEVYDFYMKNIRYVNNWDLVDTSAPCILGNYLTDKKRSVLYKMAKGGLWERRISIVATYEFIKNGDVEDTLRICEMLLGDRQDLIHKACGWMLREAGKKDIRNLENFLKKHRSQMPRTMLRYAIEKFPESKRKSYLCQ